MFDVISQPRDNQLGLYLQNSIHCFPLLSLGVGSGAGVHCLSDIPICYVPNHLGTKSKMKRNHSLALTSTQGWRWVLYDDLWKVSWSHIFVSAHFRGKARSSIFIGKSNCFSCDSLSSFTLFHSRGVHWRSVCLTRYNLIRLKNGYCLTALPDILHPAT